MRFIAVNDNFDSLTATIDESFLMVPLKNLVNETYARDISKKVQLGFKSKRQRGEFCGSFAPYGYVKEGSSLIIDDEAAAVVKQIYKWRLEGMGIMAIVKKLNSLNILPPSRHRFEKGIAKARKYEESLFWYSSTVKRVLSNPMYTGNLAQGRYKSNFLSGGNITPTEENEWVICKDSHPPIIPQEIFDAARQIRESRRNEYKYNSDNHTENIFRGLIVCGDCGKHMARERRKTKFSFVCYVSKSVSSQACTQKVIREADLHTALYTYIRCEITLAVDMNRIITELQNQKSYQHQQGILDKQISALKRKLEQNRRFRGSLREDFKDEILTEQDYTTMKADYDNEKEQLQQSLNALLAEQTKQNATMSSDNKWVSEFRRFESEEQLSAGMVSALVKQIRVYDDGRIEVVLRYRDELENLQSYIGNFQGEARAANA